MQFIKVELYEKKNKNYLANLLIVYFKFILLFIPKIFMFLFSFFFFYGNFANFNHFFDAKVTFEYIKKYVFNYHCIKNYNFLFSNYIYNNSIVNERICNDFTFIYINIFICTLVFMILLYILFLFRSIIIEFIFIFINLGLFIGLMFIIEDKYQEKDKYLYYHFKGEKYTTEKVYLSLGVYHFGFILGILCFNYANIKNINKKKNGNLRSENNIIKDNFEIDNIYEDSVKSGSSYISYKINNKEPYYPLSFCNKCLSWMNKIKFSIRIIMVILFTIIIGLLSNFYRFYGKNSSKSNEYNYDRDYVLMIEFDQVIKYYFIFEKHFFLLFFFIINIILITLSKNGFYKRIINLKLITAISRAGFTIVCLSHILSTLSLCGFLVKVKFDIITFIFISFGNFVMTFIVSISLNMVFELLIRIFIKNLIRKCKKE